MSTKKVLGLELKQKNRNRIYRYILEHDCVAKQEIVTALELSLPTVTQNLDDLLLEKLIMLNGTIGNTGGRRARGYSIAADARVSVGIDINQKHLAIVLLNLKGSVIKNAKWQVSFENSEDYFLMLSTYILGFLEELPCLPDQILGVGICVQGVISFDGNEILYGPVSKIENLKLYDYGHYIPYKTRLFHDADAAAYSELLSDKEIQNAVYLNLSTNLGSSLILNREIYKGEKGFGGKIEHMTFREDGPPCYCGKTGCAECYLSTSSLLEQSEDRNLQEFFNQLNLKSEKHIDLWDNYQNNLAMMINNLRMLFDCDVILGGYIAEYLEPYVHKLKELTYNRNCFPWKADYIRLCKSRMEPAATGAALKLIEEFIISA